MQDNLFDLKKTIFFRFILAIIFVGVIFFLPAGSLKYWQAWIYCGVIFTSIFFITIYLIKNDPKLLKRRMKYKEKEKEQKIITKIATLIFLIGFIIPGFDYRYHWSNVPATIVIIANTVILLSYIFFFLIFKENSYGSRTIEVEKGQKVISTGPYSIVRHPMYLGATLMFLCTPLALGSFWSLIAFAPSPLIFIFRILNEEKVLLRDLPGYKEYCQKTQYRLLPFIW